MNKIKYLIITLFFIFVFSGNINALSIKADTKDHGFTATDLGGRGSVTECSVDNKYFSARVENGRCIVKSNVELQNDTSVSINYKWKYAGSGGSSSSQINVSKVVVNNNKVDVSPTDNAASMDVCNFNENPTIGNLFKLGAIVIMIVKIVVPIILIIFGMIDMSKAVIDSKEDAILKSAITFGKRSVLAILVFLTPNIILALFNMLDRWDSQTNEFSPCINCLFDVTKCNK